MLSDADLRGWLGPPSRRSHLQELAESLPDEVSEILYSYYALVQVTHGLEHPVVRIRRDNTLVFFNWVFLDYIQAEEEAPGKMREDPESHAMRYAGRKLDDFLATEDRQVFEDLKARSLERYDRMWRSSRRLGVVGEVAIVGMHGAKAPCRVTITYSRVYDAFQVSFTDISDLKEAEAGLRLARDELERRVAERTAELAEANEQLRQEVLARKRAEEELRQVIDLVPDYIWAQDAEGRMVLANKAVADDYNTTPEAIVGTLYHERVPAGIRIDRPTAADAEVLRTGTPITVPYHYSLYRSGKTRVSRHAKIPYVPPGATEPIVLNVATDITQLEENIAIIHALEHPVIRISQDNTVGFVNNVFLEFADVGGLDELLGSDADRARASVAGSSFLRFIVPEEHDLFEHTKALAKEKRLSGRHRFRIGESETFTFVSLSGTRLPVRITLTYAKNYDTYQLAVEDITELRKSEAALRHSELLYRSTINALTDLIHVVDRDLRITLYNEPFWEAFRSLVPEAGVVGEPLLESFPFLASDRIAAEYAQVFDTGEILATQEEHFLADRRIVVDVRKIPIIGGGRVERVVTVLRDITELKDHEESLKASETLYRSTIDALPDSLYVADRNMKVTLCNAALAGLVRATGSDPEEAIGKHLLRAFAFIRTDAPPDVVVRRFEEVVDTGKMLVVEDEFRSGAYEGVAEIRHIPITRDGQTDRVVVVVRNITEQKRMAERMQHAQKTESLAVLAGGIAHDFNNILMGILGYAGLAKEDLLPGSPVLEYVAQIENGARRATELTRQMLAYSGTEQLSITDVDMSRLVSNIAGLLRVTMSKKVTLHLRLAEALPVVQGDGTQLQQVVMNLITNASEAIGDNQGTIDVETGVTQCDTEYLSDAWLTGELPEGEYVFVAVSDTGCGMSQATLARIFDPFFSTKFTGRGLGLAAVLGIIRAHKGTIKVTSEPGSGSVFRVLLPAGGAGALGDAEPGDTEEWRGEGTVLVVDDEPAVRAVTRGMLERAGFDVLVASDGQDAIEVFREQQDRVIAVVLDLAMPRMSGKEALAEIRTISPMVAVLLATGYAARDADVQVDDDPFCDYIQKPYDTEDLLAGLQKLLTIDPSAE